MAVGGDRRGSQERLRKEWRHPFPVCVQLGLLRVGRKVVSLTLPEGHLQAATAEALPLPDRG